MTRGCTLPAAACSHRDVTVETTGVSPTYMRSEGLSRDKNHNVEAEREQQ